ncbi:MAG: hypothetical protein HY951_00595 [Bacteroidia bacterium]|nr:hypothetical protein [Bacteroidia bacterium]
MGLFNIFNKLPDNIFIEVCPTVDVLQNSLISNFHVSYVEIKIINKSDFSLFLENPKIKTSKKINGSFEHNIPAPVGLYPFHLKCSESHSIKLMLPDNVLDKLSPENKIRFVFYDVLKVKYQSRKYTIAELTIN